jgi:hypothetical protein
MEKQFATYEQSLALRELGFGELCFGSYYNNGDFTNYLDIDGKRQMNHVLLAPLKSQVFEWFREKYSIVGYVVPHNGKWTYKIISNKINIELNGFKTYVDAELSCIDKLIELVKNK